MAEFSCIIPKMVSELPGVEAWFTLRNAAFNADAKIPGLNLAVSTEENQDVVLANRRSLFHRLGMQDAAVARGKQIHGTRVHGVKTGGIHSDGDGFVTDVPGVAVSVLVADCAAVLMADPEARIVAAVHAGWRGAIGGIVMNGVKVMCELGADPGRIRAFTGPCISVAHFEVGEEVASQFPASVVIRESGKKPHIDLKSFIHGQLLESGLSEAHIEMHPDCTFADQEAYYSYRRQGGASGRMLAIIRMAPHHS